MGDFGLALSEPRVVMTRNGERTIRSAPPTEEFWTAWREDKGAVKEAGYSVSKNGMDWQVTKWETPLTREERTEAREMSRAVDLNIDIPAPEGCTYLPYQRAGIAYAVSREGCLIADEMGLGKTIQAIGTANVTGARRILVICPATLRLNWRKEINAWSTAGLPVHVMQAGCTFPRIDEGWVIINYDILHRYERELRERSWDLLIADEAHYCKNAKARRTKAVLGGGRGEKAVEAIPATKRVLLTGTPIMNRPSELYTLIHYLDPSRWRSFYSFATRYCGAYNNGFGLQMGEPQNLDELQARLRETIMVRRLKSEVLTDLPPKRRQVITLEPKDEATRRLIREEREAHEKHEAALYEAQVELQRAEASGDENAFNAAVKKLTDVQKVQFEQMSRLRHDVALAKVSDVIEHLESAGEKVVIFAHHKDVVAKLVTALREEGGVVAITGDTPMEDRQRAVEAFQGDPSVRYFVGNMQAAGVGITLTASSHVVFAELDWVPATMSQAEDRCHRIGQTDSVLVQHVVLDGSLDARIANSLIAKQEIIDRALDQETDVDIYGTEYVPPASVPTAPTPAAVPQAAPVLSARRAETERIAASLTPEQIEAIHSALRILSSMDDDRASQQNMMGFNGGDTMFGNELAARSSLTPRQAAVGYRMVRKYRRQYGPDLYERIYGIIVTEADHAA